MPRPVLTRPEDTGEKPLRPIEPPETGESTMRGCSPAGMMAGLAAAVIFLMALVIAASASNHTRYYLKAANGAIEIWRGRFAPMGRERILILPGAQPPSSVKNNYSKDEINAIAFNYYIDRADMLLEAPDMPDFNGIKRYLKAAMSYGVTDEMRRAAFDRLNHLDMMIYLYKADVAASKGTLEDFKKALEFMQMAATLKLDKARSDLVNMRIQSIQELMAALRDKNIKPPDGPPGVPAHRQNLRLKSERPPR